MESKVIVNAFFLALHQENIFIPLSVCVLIESHTWEKPYSTLIDAILTIFAVFGPEHEYPLPCQMELPSPDQA